MTFELWILFAATLLGLVHIAAASFTFKAQVGNAYTVGPRDEARAPTGVAGRLDRALRNFLETFPLFAVLVLLVHVSGRAGAASQWGAALYLGGRVLFLPLYALGVPWLRTFSWNLATLGLVGVGAQLLLAAAR
ncbi:MAG: MAPEG family protein [Myxococcota bacterium]|nr:MAPEG family protein [Myxococcota bacterium]